MLFSSAHAAVMESRKCDSGGGGAAAAAAAVAAAPAVVEEVVGTGSCCLLQLRWWAVAQDLGRQECPFSKQSWAVAYPPEWHESVASQN